MKLFQKQPDARQVVRESKSQLTRETRGLEREVQQLRREEEKLKRDIQAAAKKNDMATVKVLAKVTAVPA